MKVVTICGSMKFEKEMLKVAGKLEKEGSFSVIQPVYFDKNEKLSDDDLKKLADAHFKKIDISDAIFVVNVGGYVGSSTRKEIEYARQHGKEVLFLEN